MSRKEDILYNKNSNNDNDLDKNLTSENETKDNNTKKEKITKTDVIKFLLYILAIFLITFCILLSLKASIYISVLGLNSILNNLTNKSRQLTDNKIFFSKLPIRPNNPSKFVVWPFFTLLFESSESDEDDSE